MKNKTILGLICLFTLGLAACGPDTVSRPSFRPVMDWVAPNRIIAGEKAEIHYYVGVVNAGTEPTTPGATLTVYRSPDATITSRDAVAGKAHTIPAIAAGKRYDLMPTSRELEAEDAVVGVLYYGACLTVPSEEAGVESTVLCSRGVELNIFKTAGEVGTASITLESTGAPGLDHPHIVTNDPTPIVLTLPDLATVSNTLGTGPSSPGVEVKFYHSTTPVIDLSAEPATARELNPSEVLTIPILNARMTYSLDDYSGASFTTAALDAGLYYYGACLSGPGTTPSCTETATLRVGPEVVNVTLPDTAPTLSHVSIPVNTDAFVKITLNSDLTNEGNIASSDNDDVIVTFYRSTTEIIDLLAEPATATALTAPPVVTIPSLDPGATHPLNSSATIYLKETKAKSYYYGACLSGPGTTHSCTKTQAFVFTE